MNALKSGSNLYWPDKVTSASCVYPRETLLWTGNSTQQITVNGTTYKISQH